MKIVLVVAGNRGSSPRQGAGHARELAEMHMRLARLAIAPGDIYLRMMPRTAEGIRATLSLRVQDAIMSIPEYRGSRLGLASMPRCLQYDGV